VDRPATRTSWRGLPPAELIADLDRDGIERALVLPNYGVPDASISFGFNPLVLEAAAADDRIRCGPWVSPRTAAGDGKLGNAMLRDNFAALYDTKQ
jgi:hypothetical protein